MKKTLVILLALVMAFGLFACTNSGGGNSAPPSNKKE